MYLKRLLDCMHPEEKITIWELEGQKQILHGTVEYFNIPYNWTRRVLTLTVIDNELLITVTSPLY